MRFARLRRVPAPALLALLYLALIAGGAVLLALPVAQTGAVTFWDALFMSTSAVTVTGLVVVDPGTDFTFFGQAVIALLIQLGGLGLMSFAVLILSALGLPVGLPQRMILREEVNQTSLSDLTVLVRGITAISLICEAVGAALLCLVFVPEFGWGPGLWHAVFHSISAFNNAGFALFPGSLSDWVDDPIVNMTIPALFILGGLGFVVVVDIWRQRGWRRLSLHSKIMLAGTAVLIGWGCTSFAVLEWTNPGTLGRLEDTGARLWASWFQGVTPRTAGFNTVDTGAMRDSTTLMTITLMLVGGGPTSTAGGIKVTTLIVLLLATIAFFRRRTHLSIFGRALGTEQVMKVLALVTVSMLVVLTAIFLVSISYQGHFMDLAFEVSSAFGTVGLSRGITGELDAWGRTVVMVLMFLGRVGPLTLGFFLATRSTPRVRYPAGQIFLG
jgi:trk system potassium uptake protein TrkH